MSKFEVFEQRKQALRQMEEKAVEKQHTKGKLTARERLNVLFDEGTFYEISSFVDARVQND